MSDALSKFISGLQMLDANNLGAPQNKAALTKFQSLPNTEQRDVLNGLAGKYNASFDELAALPEADKQRVAQNLRDGKSAFDGVNRAQQQAQQEAPKTFNERWNAASEAARREQPGQEVYRQSHADFGAQHGGEAQRVRHGYTSPAREAQLSRVAAIQKEAAISGRSFGDVADEFVRSGR